MHYRFSWFQNGVEISWWIEDLADDVDADARAEEIEEQEARQLEDLDPEEMPAGSGGVSWEIATAEDIHRARKQEIRQGESAPLIPPEDLVI